MIAVFLIKIFLKAQEIFVSSAIQCKMTLMADDVEKLIEELLKVDCSISSIEFAYPNIYIGCDAVKRIAEALEKNKSVTFVDLSEAHACSKGAKAIAKMLLVNKSIDAICLGSNEIKNDDVKEIAKALKVNTSLTYIDLNFNCIGDYGASELAEALKVNKKITCVDLRYNDITDEGAEEIAEMLKVNKSLWSLDLENNKIGRNGIRCILSALEENYTITYFGNIVSYHCDVIKRNVRLQWVNQHCVILDMCIVLYPLELSPYVLLWIYDQFGPGEAAIKEIKKIRLIESIRESIRAVICNRHNTINSRRCL